MKSETVAIKDYGIAEVLKTLGIQDVNRGACTGTVWLDTQGEEIESYSSSDGALIGKIRQATTNDYEAVIVKAQEAYKVWRMMPAPKRGEIVRQMGDQLRKYKEPLGKLVSYEMGKIYQEGLGAVSYTHLDVYKRQSKR